MIALDLARETLHLPFGTDKSAAVTVLSSAESTGRYKLILRLTESESGPEPVASFARARSACRAAATPAAAWHADATATGPPATPGPVQAPARVQNLTRISTKGPGW